MKIIVDTREQDLYLLKEFEKLGVEFVRKKLDFGDYSFIDEGVNYSDKFVIERKKSFDEIITNISKEGRFYREFHHARKKGIHIIIFIEQTEQELKKHRYRSKRKPYEVKKMIETFSTKYLVELHLLNRNEVAYFILKKFKEWRL